jgi:GT2 family glycosyltransferase
VAKRSLHSPVQLLDIELTEPLPGLARDTAASGVPYGEARILVRLHTQPIGLLDVDLQLDGMSPAELALQIEAKLGDELRAHLEGDGIEFARLGEEGWLPSLDPACMGARAALLADAPTVSVIIPTRARHELVVNCVQAVLSSEYPADRFRVIVVDNVPPDHLTHDAVTTTFADESRVSYVRCDTPGSAAARNRGIEVADSEFVAMVDDDIVVDRHWLAELMIPLRANASVACATGAILPLELETEAQVLMERFGGFHKGFDFRHWSLETPPPGEPLFPYTAGRFGSGNNVGYRRSSIRDLGGYDPVLGNGTPAHAGEDFELFLRIVRSGYGLTYQPTAVAWHLHRREHIGLGKVVTDYGMGITAVLTRTVMNDPRAVLEIARRVAPGLVYLLSAQSPKNAGHGDHYPARLRVRELAGILRGPFAYLKSRRITRLRARRARGAP